MCKNTSCTYLETDLILKEDGWQVSSHLAVLVIVLLVVTVKICGSCDRIRCWLSCKPYCPTRVSSSPSPTARIACARNAFSENLRNSLLSWSLISERTEIKYSTSFWNLLVAVPSPKFLLTASILVALMILQILWRMVSCKSFLLLVRLFRSWNLCCDLKE